MELSLQTSPVLAWRHDHYRLWAGQTRFSSSQLGALARKSEHRSAIRCNGSGSGRESVEEKPAPEVTSSETASGMDSGSWVQGEGNSDPFFGWTSDGSQQANAKNAAGLIKLGGVIVLTLGFALGARSLYLKRDVAKAFTISPPATEEETAHSSSKARGVEEAPHNVDLNGSVGVPETTAEGEETKQTQNENDVSDAQLEEKGVEAPVSPQEMGSEGHMDEELSSIGDVSASVPVSDKSGDGEVLETSAAAEQPPAELVPSPASTSPEEDLSPVFSESDESAVMHASTVPEENLSPGFSENVDLSDGDSTPWYTSADDQSNVKGNLEESNMLDEATGEEPTLDESFMHDDDSFEILQETSPAFEDGESLGREGDYEKAARQEDKWVGAKPSADFFASIETRKGFLPATITAPSTLSDSSASSLGEVVVPAHVDHMQEQIVAALQALKVIENDVKPGDICTRREYARWLMAASASLTRSPAHKVLPAMYIENVSMLAYEDVTPQDQDFPFIQGLAEAGLLSSRLVDEDHDGGDQEKINNSVFSPDSPLTRQDLVTWKVALERKPAVMDGIPTSSGSMALQDKFGFIDVDKIREDAWPALLVDMSAGDQSIIALAFGHTRRLQPQKPVTKGQAAVALATGEAWELVSEELSRLEAESVAEAAVVAELALEAKAQKEVAAAFEKLIQVEREKQQVSASMLESTHAELEQMKAAHESEKFGLLKDRAAIDAEKELLTNARLEVEQQALALSSAKLEAAFQREQADKLRAEAEEERALISKVRSELEIEKNALILARAWAEDEAKKAQEHSIVLEQARSRWESRGIQVNVDKELDTIDEKVKSFSPSWQYDEGAEEAQETPAVNDSAEEKREDLQAQNSPMDGVVEKSKEIARMLVDAIIRFFHFLQLLLHAIQQRATELFGKARGKFHETRIRVADRSTKTMEGLKQTIPSSVAGLTSSLKEGTLKTVDEWKGGAERLSQKFKTP